MTTTALPRGRLQEIYAAYTSAFGADQTTGFLRLNAYTPFRFTKGSQLGEEPITGGVGFHNSIDARPAAPGLQDAQGSGLLPFDLTQLGFWLKGLLAAPVTTGTTPKIHTYASGGLTIPTIDIERRLASNQIEKLKSAAVRSMRFPIGAAAGYHDVAIELMARELTDPYSSPAVGTPADLALSARVPKTIGLIKNAGVQIGSVISGELTITNDLAVDRYAGDGNKLSLIALQGRSAEVTMQARYNTDVLRNLGNVSAVTGLPTAQALTLEWTLSASLNLVIDLPEVLFDPVDAPVENGGVITVSMKGRAQVAAASPLLTAVLKNALAGY